MKLQFKIQPYQTDAVDSVVDCFAGQPFADGVSYRIDPGKGAQPRLGEDSGFRNAALAITGPQFLANVQSVQRRQNAPPATSPVSSKAGAVDIDGLYAGLLAALMPLLNPERIEIAEQTAEDAAWRS